MRVAALIALTLLAGCERRDAVNMGFKGGRAAAVAGAAEGQLSIDAPGLAMNVDIPAGLIAPGEEAGTGLLYPDAVLSGMHVAARDVASGERPAVELHFITGAAASDVARWYRDPARAGSFKIASAARAGDVFSFAGTQRDDGDPFDLRIAPRAGGGADGRLRLRDKG